MFYKKIRIDRYLATKYGLSRAKVVKMIKANSVFFKGIKICSPSWLLNKSEGDYVTIDKTFLNNGQEKWEITPTPIDINIVYEDNYLLIVNKPSGLLIHPTKYGEKETLANGIANYFSKTKNVSVARSGIVHRLDRCTSGLVLIAKSTSIMEKLQKKIKNGEIKRFYLAIVTGNFAETCGSIEAMIGYHSRQKMKMKVNGINAKKALTYFSVLCQNEQLALITCELTSGRTHQIRVHMSYINHPILNDPLYNKNSDVYGQFLHAYKLKFIHPITETLIQIKQLPDETFQNKMKENNFLNTFKKMYEKI